MGSEWEKASKDTGVRKVLSQYRPGTDKNPAQGKEHFLVHLLARLGGTDPATVSRRKKDAEHEDKVQTLYDTFVQQNTTPEEQKAAQTLAKSMAAEGTFRGRNTKTAMERNALSIEGALRPPHCSCPPPPPTHTQTHTHAHMPGDAPRPVRVRHDTPT